jgi:MFS family permease
VSVALPTIQRELGVGLNGLEWVIKAYSLTLAVFTLLAGRLADRDGRRRMFLIGLGSFVLGSPASGLAPSGGLLIAARAVKGLGAALVAPASLAIIAETFSKRERGMALGVWAGASASALGFGPCFQPRLSLMIAPKLDLLAQRAALLLRLAARPCRPSGVTRSSRPTEP